MPAASYQTVLGAVPGAALLPLHFYMSAVFSLVEVEGVTTCRLNDSAHASLK
jgi:hypothetical protein